MLMTKLTTAMLKRQLASGGVYPRRATRRGKLKRQLASGGVSPAVQPQR